MIPEQIGMVKFRRVRWKFEFPNRPVVFGMWDGPGKGHHAWKVNKYGLLYAVIQIKEWENPIVKDAVRCSGPEFRNFQWLAAAPVPKIWNIKKDSSGKTRIEKTDNFKKPAQLNQKAIYGLCMWTRDEKVTVFVNGPIKRELLTEYEKTMHLAGYGR